MHLFHNANLFGVCIIHILYTECAKIKKKIPAPKGLYKLISSRRIYMLRLLNVSYIISCCQLADHPEQ